PPSETAVPADKTAPDDSSVTELPLNIDVLRRYSRQQRKEITSRLRESARESSDQAFTRTARSLRMSIDDETALTWGPKVTAAKDMALTPEEAKQRWREQLRIEAERRADNYAAAAAEYQKKKAEAALRQAQQKEATQKHGISEGMIASIGAQLRDCRIFVSDEVVRSVAGGARIRHGEGLLAADNGRLREVKVWRAGEKGKLTSEYISAWGLITRWKRAIG
ncbi:TPA: replication endonuclease, partial [Klebsiella quasipneumoniae subsp. quasipneumoniae]|nr:replication endonuclease [Klebsiella quasipneumoniae subsp. quasipneumoniae]